MKVLGLTGGIGAGKSTVASFFIEKNIAVFDSDSEAKKLYVESTDVRNKVIQLLGKEAYKDDKLNRSYVAGKVFTNQTLLEQLNGIIHPALKDKFQDWKSLQTSEFVVDEAAILFESGGYKLCDAILTVTAYTQIRIERVMKRDNLSQEEVINRIEKQWPEQRKIELSDFVLYNNSDEESLKLEFDEMFPEIVYRLT